MADCVIVLFSHGRRVFFDVKGFCYAISYIVKGRQVVLHEAKSTRLGKYGGRKQNKQLGQMEVGDIEKYSWGKWG